MSSFQLDNDGDLLVTNNRLTLTTGAEAVKQHLQSRLRTFLGEWFLDTSIGVPWFQEVLVKQPSFQVIQSVLKSIIVDTPGILELTFFEFDYDNSRELTLEIEALTSDGPIDFTQIVEV